MVNRRKRPKLANFFFDEHEWSALDELARRGGLTKSDWVRQSIRRAFANAPATESDASGPEIERKVLKAALRFHETRLAAIGTVSKSPEWQAFDAARLALYTALAELAALSIPGKT